MFVAITRTHVDPRADWLLETQLKSAMGLEKAPGFIEFLLLKRIWNPEIPEINDEVEFLICTHWDSQESFDAWSNSADGRTAYSKFTTHSERWGAPAEISGYEVRSRRVPHTLDRTGVTG